MRSNDIKPTGAFLFQLVLSHDVHGSLHKYLGLASCLFKEIIYSICYALWLSGVHTVSAEPDKLK